MGIATAAPAESRRAARRGLFLSAIALANGEHHPIRMRNISAGGAMIESPDLPETGAIDIRRAEHRVRGSIVWARGKQRGVRFHDTVDLADWLPSVGMQGQQRLDARIAAVRDGGKESAEPHDDSLPVVARIGEELKLASRKLERTLDSLSDFAPVVQRNATELQNLEVLQQLLRHLSAVLEAEDPVDAAAKIGMDDVRRRLLR